MQRVRDRQLWNVSHIFISLPLPLSLSPPPLSLVSTKSIFAELEVLQRQLTKTERYANEIADHKTMDPTSTAKIKAEVQLFVKRYKQKAESLDEKGRSMMSTYGKILVSIPSLISLLSIYRFTNHPICVSFSHSSPSILSNH